MSRPRLLVTVAVLGATMVLVPGCGNESTGAAAPSAVSSAPDEPPAVPDGVLDGTYRVDYDENELVNQGVPRNEAQPWAGLITVTLLDGQVTLHDHNGGWPDCSGSYSVTGSQLTLDLTSGCDPVSWTFDWSLSDELLSLRLIATSDHTSLVSHQTIFGSKPWSKIE